MGSDFDGKLNQNSERNDEAMSGGLILDSHLLDPCETSSQTIYLFDHEEGSTLGMDPHI